MSWRSLDKINLILSNSFEIWWCDMWVMLMSNCALVRILVLWFVIPYASPKVNSYAMKLHPTCGALFGVTYAWCSCMRFFVSWLDDSQSFCLPSFCTKYDLYLCIQNPLNQFCHMSPLYLPICGIILPF